MSGTALSDALWWFRNARTAEVTGGHYPAAWLPPERDPPAHDYDDVLPLGAIRRHLLAALRAARLDPDDFDLVCRFFGLTGYPEQAGLPANTAKRQRGALAGTVPDRRATNAIRPAGDRAIRERLRASIADVRPPPAPPRPITARPLPPYRPRPPLTLVWFRTRHRTGISESRLPELRRAVLRALDEVPEGADRLRSALSSLLLHDPPAMRRAGLTWPRTDLPPVTSATITPAGGTWRRRAYSSVAIHLWDLTQPRPVDRPARAEPVTPPALLAALVLVPGEFVDCLQTGLQRIDISEMARRLRAQDRTQSWMVDLARMLLRGFRAQSGRRPLPAAVQHEVLEEATLTHAVHGLWTAVPLTRELLDLPTISRRSLDIALRTVPLASNGLAHPVALDLLKSIAEVLNSDRPAVGPPLSEVYVAETWQQIDLLRAGALASYLQVHLPGLLRGDAAASEQIAERALRLAEAARRRLEGLPPGWENGGHGGDARASWLVQPVLSQASVALAAHAALIQTRGASLLLAPSFDRVVGEAKALLDQSSDDHSRPRLHGDVRLARLRLTMALAHLDADEYADLSAHSHRLLQQAAAGGPHFSEGLAENRFLDLDDLARDVIGFAGHTVPETLQSAHRISDGVPALRGLLGLPTDGRQSAAQRPNR